MERVNDINKISKALEKSRDKLNHYLSTLGWKQEVLREENLVKCSVNEGHSLPTSSLQQHVYKCKMNSEGIDPKDICPSSHFFYKNSLAVVPVMIDKKKYESFKQKNQESVNKKEAVSSNKIGKAGTMQIPGQDQMPCDIPLTMSASNSDLSSSQRSIMYDYVIQTAKAIKRRAAEDELDDLEHLEETTDQKDNQSEPKSHLEELAEMRDYKRRRQSYRAKNVHMTKRTNVEVMRDLIETQMKVLQEQSQD